MSYWAMMCDLPSEGAVLLEPIGLGRLTLMSPDTLSPTGFRTIWGVLAVWPVVVEHVYVSWFLFHCMGHKA